MVKLLDKLPEQIQEMIKLCSSLAKDLGFKVYLVGGFVRDLILGGKNFDLDIVVEGDGIEFAKRISERLNTCLPTGKTRFIYHKRFGTATITDKSHTFEKVRDKFKIDIATARKEIYEYPGSLPKVSFGNITDDLARRDFTINAMAIDISEGRFGRLIDQFGGRKDLKSRLIRILHPLSFIDDSTRVLRAIRFKERFNFKFEKETLKILKEAVRRNFLEKIGKHRLRDELIPILKEDYPLKYIYRIKSLYGFKFIHPRLVLKNFDFLKKIKNRILWFKNNLVGERELDSWLIYLTGLLDPLSRRETNHVLKSFAFRKGEKKRVISYKEKSDSVIKKLEKRNLKPHQIFRILESLSYEVIILISSKTRKRIVEERIKDFLKIYNKIKISVKGRDLKDLGASPGPEFKKILRETLYRKIDGKIKTKEEELQFLRDKIK